MMHPPEEVHRIAPDFRDRGDIFRETKGQGAAKKIL